VNAAFQPIPLGFSVAFLVVGPAGPILVDAGLPGSERRIWAALRRRGLRPQDLRAVVLTHAHFDHCGCLPALLRASRAPLAAHPLAAACLRGEAVRLPPGRTPRGRAMVAAYWLYVWGQQMPALAVDQPLVDGDTLAGWGLPLEVLHTPGHSADSLTLLLPQGVALVGDLLARRGRHAVSQPDFVEDDTALARSLGKLRERRPRVVYTSHCARPLHPAWH
jgi:glyoxylase-like metal-dependent hydrolase (beta-lactamase superfamily II)